MKSHEIDRNKSYSEGEHGMGLLDLFKKKNAEQAKQANDQANENANDQSNDKANNKTNDKVNKEEKVETAGWDAIEAEFLRVYPTQEKPVHHYGTLIKWIFGGNDPLDGISIYDGGTYWHFVSFGLSEIYGKESDDKEVSGYGYELTLKLKKYDFEDEEAELKNICGILQAIARITFTKGEIFLPNEFIYTGQQTGMDAKQKSNLTGFITIADTSVQAIDTPNGRVEFLELIGMTDAELKTLSNKASVMELYEKLGSDLTDYHRESLA